MEKFSELKRDRDCRKRTGNKLRHWCVLMCFTVEWMYLGIQRQLRPHHTAELISTKETS